MKKEPELEGIEGKGVSLLEIKEIDSAIAKYERKKEARCQETPGEVAAKQDLTKALHKHREELPRDSDGIPYYRSYGKDYLLQETLKTRKVDEGEGED